MRFNETKSVNSSYGNFQIDVPQDRQSSFQPQVVSKRQKEIATIDEKIISIIYPIIFIDAIHFSVRHDNMITKSAAYFVMGINEDGRKEVLTIEVGEN